MKDIFGKREQSEEAKFKLDSETRFKAHSRRNRRLGLWAAERMGLSAPEAEAYAHDVIAADFEEPGDGDVLRKLQNDLRARGVPIEEDELRGELERHYAAALAELRGEYPSALGADHEKVGD